MPRKRHSAEEIIGRLREVEVMVGRGGSLGEAVRSIGVTEQTYLPFPGPSRPGCSSRSPRFRCPCFSAAE